MARIVFDIHKVGFSFVANYPTKAKADAAAKVARFGESQSVYTRFTKAWIVGEWESEHKADLPDHLLVLTKDGRRASLLISRGVSCLGTKHSLVLSM